MPEAARLFVATARRKPMREVERVLAIRDRGFDGCVHGRPGSRRQVLLVEAETLEEFGLAPGIIRENITRRGRCLGTLAAGQRLRVGEATLEVTVACEPCERMDEIRMGLQQDLELRRGMLCRVVEGGWIERSDSIELMECTEKMQTSGGRS